MSSFASQEMPALMEQHFVNLAMLIIMLEVQKQPLLVPGIDFITQPMMKPN